MTAIGTDIAALARRLDTAQRSCTATPSLENDTSLRITFDVDTAYRVQHELIGLRIGRDERLVVSLLSEN